MPRQLSCSASGLKRMAKKWNDVWVAERARLLIECTVNPYRGFKSLSFRKFNPLFRLSLSLSLPPVLPTVSSRQSYLRFPVLPSVSSLTFGFQSYLRFPVAFGEGEGEGEGEGWKEVSFPYPSPSESKIRRPIFLWGIKEKGVRGQEGVPVRRDIVFLLCKTFALAVAFRFRQKRLATATSTGNQSSTGDASS